MRTENAERRHPMQVFVALLLALSGIPTLVGGPQPNSLSAALPVVLVYVVSGVFTAGGALVVAAAAVRNAETALYLEFSAALPLALALSAYAAAATTLGGARAVVPVALLVGLAAAFVTRAVTTYRTIRDLRAALGRRK
jgi:hypothetical protein